MVKTNIKHKSLIIVIFVNFLISVIEIMGGYLSGSLLLISDAIHNLSDTVSAIISYVAAVFSDKKINEKYTFGYKRAEIIAAFVNSLVLGFITIYIILEAILKLISPTKIIPTTMLVFAIICFLGNLFSTLILHNQSKSSLNIKSTYLHMLSDSLASLAVIAGALIILFFKIYQIDSIFTIIIAIYIIKEAYHVLAKSTKILMEGSTGSFSIEEIQHLIESIDKIKSVYHLHMWSIGDSDVFLELHIELDNMLLSQAEQIKQKVIELLKEKGISHVNIQFECDSNPTKSLLCKERP